MTDNRTQSFATALQELEHSGDVDDFTSRVFAGDAELVRPETGQHESGTGGVQEFWQQYLAQFQDVRSEFSRIVDADTGILEWTSRGHLASGTAIDYAGVSLVDFDADGLVTRFATYYDTAPFTLA